MISVHSSSDKKKPHLDKLISYPLKKAQSSLMFGLAVLCLTSVFGYRYYNQPQLGIGTIAPETILAPRNERFQDTKKTEEIRQQARTGINPILRRNTENTEEMRQKLQTLLVEIDNLRQKAGVIPFISTDYISIISQQYLRSCSASDWQNIQKKLKDKSLNSITQDKSIPLITKKQKVIAELKRYQQKIPDFQFQILIDNINLVRQEYIQAKSTLKEDRPSDLSLEVTQFFIDLPQPIWEKTKIVLTKNLERILTQGLPPGLTGEHIKQTINSQLSDSLVPPQAQAYADRILFDTLKDQWNLEIDKEATNRRAEEAAKAIEPFYVEIQKREIIVRQGDIISREDFVLLDGFGLSKREINWLGLGKTAVIVSGSLLIFCLMARRLHKPLRRRDYLLLCLLSLSTPILVIFKVPYTNLPAIGLLVSSFYGPTLAITQVALLTGLSTMTVDPLSWNALAGALASASGGFLAAAIANRLRSRDGLALLGSGVGSVQGGVYFVIHLIINASAGTIWYTLLPDAIFYGLSGLAWSIIALGISPYLERFFDVVTPIRLVELSNPNCPLLKRLAIEAPGTFQHTLLVACLAEAAARQLHCNVELVRAGTLYHDIGKMHDPLGFIENQMGCPNKHDEIDDPYQSAAIIKKHVSEGIAMARKYGLPRVIRDFIPEHQGTILIAYFYYQAKQKAQEEGREICEECFHYDGPIPQSRETGIVMLADGCEAALRSLKEATPEMAKTTIIKIFNARWRDNQLKDSGLKPEELNIIADVFVQVWQQFHHQRITYPKAALEPQVTKI